MCTQANLPTHVQCFSPIDIAVSWSNHCAYSTLVLRQGYIDGFSVTVVFRNKAQHAGNGHSPCQVLQRSGGTPQ